MKFSKANQIEDLLITYFVFTIIIIKGFFVLSEIVHLYFSHIDNKSIESKKKDTKALYIKDLSEFLFTIGIAFLLFYIFNPFYNRLYLLEKDHVKILFYLFGIILICTSNWYKYFYDYS